MVKGNTVLWGVIVGAVLEVLFNYGFMVTQFHIHL